MKRMFLAAVSAIGLSVLAGEPRGAVCFTFDDYFGENWLKACPMFRKYNAHATFLIAGEITVAKAEVMKKLRAEGHSIGLHTLQHRDALPFIHEQGGEKYFGEQIRPQLDACRKHGLVIRNFAYPNNRRDEVSDKIMFDHFDYLRAGNGPMKKTIFYPLRSLRKKMVLGGTGIGKYYKSDISELKKKLDHAWETDSLVVFFSHDIRPAAEHVNMPSEWLEELLSHARERNMRIIGFDELKSLTPKN